MDLHEVFVARSLEYQQMIYQAQLKKQFDDLESFVTVDERKTLAIYFPSPEILESLSIVAEALSQSFKEQQLHYEIKLLPYQEVIKSAVCFYVATTLDLTLMERYIASTGTCTLSTIILILKLLLGGNMVILVIMRTENPGLVPGKLVAPPEARSGIGLGTQSERREVLQFIFDPSGKQLYACPQNMDNLNTAISLLKCIPQPTA